MKNDNIKNYNLKTEWATYSIYRKICFVIFVVLITSLILGSVGGLLYLFKPKKVNAAEIIGGATDETSVSSVVVSFPIEYYLPGGYSSYPHDSIPAGHYVFSYPLIFYTKNTSISSPTDFSTLYFSSFSSSYERFSERVLTTDLNATDTFKMWSPNQDYDVTFYIKCVSSNLVTDVFGDLYSVLCTYVGGTNEPVVFEITDINGSSVVYHVTPFRSDQFGNFELNSIYQFSGRYLYIADSNVNFTERLNQAKEESYNNGYNQGYTEGKDYGYNLGYNQGVNDTDKFTFSSLLNAIFYAPLKAFISIFNFEILGVNVLNIISFLFTMLIAIGIIRWVV